MAFDLVVATLGRTRELLELLDSVREQGVAVRVVIVDQNRDDRVGRVVDRVDGSVSVARVEVDEVGTSSARNAGFERVTAPIVAWPDDDCRYPAGLLSYVEDAFSTDPALDVLVGLADDPSGRSGQFASTQEGRLLDAQSLWRYANANTLFARRTAADQVGPWSTELGPGGSTRWDAGEDTDWLIRAVAAGLRVRFDPGVRVVHRDPFLDAGPAARQRARRYGRCTVAVAMRHGYGVGFVLGLVGRAAGGVAVSALSGRGGQALLHLNALFGRVEGLAQLAVAGRLSAGSA
jgi:glycosyltransferase involved in cell wall biosynthesis